MKWDEVYVVTMYRNGDRESHSYVLGVFSTERKANTTGKGEYEHRGHIYCYEIERFKVNTCQSSFTVKGLE